MSRFTDGLSDLLLNRDAGFAPLPIGTAQTLTWDMAPTAGLNGDESFGIVEGHASTDDTAVRADTAMSPDLPVREFDCGGDASPLGDNGSPADFWMGEAAPQSVWTVSADIPA